jgi:hypothetical protein
MQSRVFQRSQRLAMTSVGNISWLAGVSSIASAYCEATEIYPRSIYGRPKGSGLSNRAA